MSRTIIIMLIVIIFIFSTVTGITKSILKLQANKVMDSQESIMTSEIDARIFRDFSNPTPPENIEFTNDYLTYISNGEIITIKNVSEKECEMSINYEDGSKWSGTVKGVNILFEEVEVVNVNNEAKVNLEDTSTRIIAVTFRFLGSDSNKMRSTLNRDYTRYLVLTR